MPVIVRIGGHSINPINVWCTETVEAEVETVVKTANSKEAPKIERVDRVRIVGIGSADDIYIEGVSQDQVDEALNIAMATSYTPREIEAAQ